MITATGLEILKEAVKEIREKQNVINFTEQKWLDEIFEVTGIEIDEDQLIEIFEAL